MFGSTMLEVAIGLTFMYILLAIFVSELIELISRMMKWRAKTLQEGIRTLLDDPTGEGLAGRVMSHPLVGQLSKSKRPSYIPARNFTLALLDRVSDAQANAAGTVADLKAAIGGIENTQLREVLLAHVNAAGNSVDRARENIEDWFDNAMDRVSGWYTRKTRLVGLVLAIIVVCVVNADSLMMSNVLAKNDALRDSLVAAASDPALTPETASDANLDVGLPVGWSLADPIRGLPAREEWVYKVVGLAISALAVSLGAPFWFQFLSRLLALRQGLRQSGAPPRSTAESRGSQPARAGNQ